MAERLRGLTITMVLAYLFYEGVAFLMSMGGMEVPFLIGLGVFMALGVAMGYKAYDQSASSSDMIELAITFIVVLAIISFLFAVFIFVISSLGKIVMQGTSLETIAGQAGMSLLEYDNFMRIMVMLLSFVASWFVLRQRQYTVAG